MRAFLCFLRPSHILRLPLRLQHMAASLCRLPLARWPSDSVERIAEQAGGVSVEATEFTPRHLLQHTGEEREEAAQANRHHHAHCCLMCTVEEKGRWSSGRHKLGGTRHAGDFYTTTAHSLDLVLNIFFLICLVFSCSCCSFPFDACK